MTDQTTPTPAEMFAQAATFADAQRQQAVSDDDITLAFDVRQQAIDKDKENAQIMYRGMLADINERQHKLDKDREEDAQRRVAAARLLDTGNEPSEPTPTPSRRALQPEPETSRPDPNDSFRKRVLDRARGYGNAARDEFNAQRTASSESDAPTHRLDDWFSGASEPQRPPAPEPPSSQPRPRVSVLRRLSS